MPIKFKPSAKEVDRNTKKVQVKHYYMKTMTKEELFKELNNNNCKNKVKSKIRNELARRHIDWSWVDPIES